MASEAWTSVDVLQTPDFMPYLAGTLGIAIRRGELIGFKDFLLGIHPDHYHNNYGNSIVSVLLKSDLNCTNDVLLLFVNSEFYLIYFSNFR